jgi:uncharacterized protein
VLKWLLVLAVVGVGLWALSGRHRLSDQTRAARKAARTAKAEADTPKSMVSCAHCGLHLPASDAVFEGSRVFCSEAHRQLGPRRRDG